MHSTKTIVQYLLFNYAIGCNQGEQLAENPENLFCFSGFPPALVFTL